jgi:glutamine amidotransferase
VRKFPRTPGYKIPHMGWNTLHVALPDHPLMEGIGEGSYVYFAHSFYADTAFSHTLATTHFICPFASAVTSGMVHGVQFHPEISGAVGLQILKNFIDLV